MRHWMIVGALAALGAFGCDDGGGSPAQEAEADAGVSADGGAGGAGGAGGEGGMGGAGAAGGAGGAGGAADDCAPADGALSGTRYVDADGSDASYYLSGQGPEDPAADLAVRVIGADGDVAVRTCADGRYTTDPLAEGVYLSWAEVADGDRCASRNCPGRFARAVAGGQVKILTVGDSIPVIGDPVMFPERLATLLGGLAEVDNVNRAVAGSTSDQWVPGARNYERNLAPEMADADLILISIGGNDIVAYVNNPALLSDIPAAVEGARDAVREVVENLRLTIAGIRAVNPDADIAYLLYADYSQAEDDRVWGLVGRFLGRETVQEVLGLARDSFPDEDDDHLLLVDMFSAADGLPLGDYLYDTLHFNGAGQQLYAESIFESLGGIVVGESPLGPEAASPLGLSRHFGLAGR